MQADHWFGEADSCGDDVGPGILTLLGGWKLMLLMSHDGWLVLGVMVTKMAIRKLRQVQNAATAFSVRGQLTKSVEP